MENDAIPPAHFPDKTEAIISNVVKHEVPSSCCSGSNTRLVDELCSIDCATTGSNTRSEKFDPDCLHEKQQAQDGLERSTNTIQNQQRTGAVLATLRPTSTPKHLPRQFHILKHERHDRLQYKHQVQDCMEHNICFTPHQVPQGERMVDTENKKNCLLAPNMEENPSTHPSMIRSNPKPGAIPVPGIAPSSGQGFTPMTDCNNNEQLDRTVQVDDAIVVPVIGVAEPITVAVNNHRMMALMETNKERNVMLLHSLH
jgi:hypothetical protein